MDLGKELYWKNAEHFQDHQCFQRNHNKEKYKRRDSYIKKPTTWTLLIVLLEVTNSKEAEELCNDDVVAEGGRS